MATLVGARLLMHRPTVATIAALALDNVCGLVVRLAPTVQQRHKRLWHLGGGHWNLHAGEHVGTIYVVTCVRARTLPTYE